MEVDVDRAPEVVDLGVVRRDPTGLSDGLEHPRTTLAPENASHTATTNAITVSSQMIPVNQTMISPVKVPNVVSASERMWIPSARIDGEFSFSPALRTAWPTASVTTEMMNCAARPTSMRWISTG